MTSQQIPGIPQGVPPQIQQMMPIEQVPVMISCAHGMGPNGPMVLISFHSPMGIYAITVPPQFIEDQLLPQLKTVAMQAKTGLVLPG